MTLDEARQSIGSGVVFRGGASSEDEDGVITSVNDTYVFVRYGGDQHGKATRPEDLTLRDFVYTPNISNPAPGHLDEAERFLDEHWSESPDLDGGDR